MTPNIAVIMAGGRGTRFWPRSRNNRPKQFLAITGAETLLRQTVTRITPDFEASRIFVATTVDLAEQCRQMLPELPPENIIIEPEGRNTAPCLALALVVIEQKFQTGVMAVLSADHWIDDAEKFRKDVSLAAKHALEKNRLVTFGITPAGPETGYGYIETSANGQGNILNAVAFREKPPLETAMEYCRTGRHYWNSGIFIWSLADFRAELSKHTPEVLVPLDDWILDGGDLSKLPDAYGKLPRISIDYALLEKSSKISVLRASFGWSDVGSWTAAAAFLEPDASGNVSKGETIIMDSENCAVFGKTRMIAISGLKDVIIVDEPDALLVIKRDDVQNVRRITDRLRELGRTELL